MVVVDSAIRKRPSRRQIPNPTFQYEATAKVLGVTPIPYPGQHHTVGIQLATATWQTSRGWTSDREGVTTPAQFPTSSYGYTTGFKAGSDFVSGSSASDLSSAPIYYAKYLVEKYIPSPLHGSPAGSARLPAQWGEQRVERG